MLAKWSAAGVLLAAGFLLGATRARAEDTIRLKLTNDVDAPTQTLGYDGTDVDTLAVGHGGGAHWGGAHWGGAHWGGARWGGARWGGAHWGGAHWGGARWGGWGWNRGWGWAGYRPWWGGYYRGWGWAGYRPWWRGYYAGWWGGYPYYWPAYYGSSVYYAAPLCGVSASVYTVPSASLGIAPVLTTPEAVPVMPRVPDSTPPPPAPKTFPYDGGPRNPPPMPKPDGAAPTVAPPSTIQVPVDGRVVSLPVSPAKKKLTYPAYGEKPRPAFAEDRVASKKDGR